MARTSRRWRRRPPTDGPIGPLRTRGYAGCLGNEQQPIPTGPPTATAPTQVQVQVQETDAEVDVALSNPAAGWSARHPNEVQPTLGFDAGGATGTLVGARVAERDSTRN